MCRKIRLQRCEFYFLFTPPSPLPSSVHSFAELAVEPESTRAVPNPKIVYCKGYKSALVKISRSNCKKGIFHMKSSDQCVCFSAIHGSLAVIPNDLIEKHLLNRSSVSVSINAPHLILVKCN